MSFPENDHYWSDVVEFVIANGGDRERVLAPFQFQEKLNNVRDYSNHESLEINDFNWIIIHKDRIKEFDSSFYRQLSQLSLPVFANEVFVIFSCKTNLQELAYNYKHLRSFWQELGSCHTYFQKATERQSDIIPQQSTSQSQLKKLAHSFMELKSFWQKLISGQSIFQNFNDQSLLFLSETVNLNIKTFGYEYARNLRNDLDIPQYLSPQKIPLISQVCKQKDIESSWFWYWCQVMQIPVNYHRKIWEFAYILQALYNYNLLVPGKKGLGFGCGEEPLPSILAAYDIAITATDLNPTESAAKGWVETNQSMSSLAKIWHPDLCSRDLFERNVSLKYVDMNNIADSLNNHYDFCWSACALEHLGSIKNGLDFIENSLDILVPGGVAIHTTELNYLKEEETIDNWATVLFRKKDFQSLVDQLTSLGHQVAPLNFDIGSGVLDRFIDLPPYDSKIHQQQQGHLKLLIDGFASTSFGLIIQKSFNQSQK